MCHASSGWRSRVWAGVSAGTRFVRAPRGVGAAAFAMIVLGLSGGSLVGCASPGPMPEGPFRSALVLKDTPERLGGSAIAPSFTGGAGVVELDPVSVPGLAFNEALVSWNVDVPPGTGARLEARVGRDVGGERLWSPYMFVADWGEAAPDGEKIMTLTELRSASTGATTPATGKIDTDFFVSDESFDAIQVRVLAAGALGSSTPVRLRRVAVTLTDGATPIGSAEPSTCADGLDREGDGSPVALAVPFRSQRTTTPELSGRLCSPTSVTMVMAYRGVDLPLDTVAAAVYDAPNDIYGNWPRNVQAAYALGVPGYLRRYSSWDEVRATFQEGSPIIASIRVKKHELRGAPYPSTAGHLIVLRGFDRDGNVLVNDPAAGTPEGGMLTYRREDLERVWLRRNAGTSYVLLPMEPTVMGSAARGE